MPAALRRRQLYRYVPLGSPRVRDARERQHRACRKGLGGAPLGEPPPQPPPAPQPALGEPQPEPQLELVDRGAGGRDGTGSEGSDAATEAATARSARRAAMPRGTTRRGGRKTSAKRSGEAWDASRVSYEIGIVLEGVVRRVEIIEVGYHGPGALDSLYWDNPFLLRSLPSMPLPCKCACCQGLPCKGSRCVGCKLCWGGCSRAFGRREGECCRVYERPGGPFLGGNSVEKLRATALRGHFGIRQYANGCVYQAVDPNFPYPHISQNIPIDPD